LVSDIEVGFKSTDKYQEKISCRNTKTNSMEKIDDVAKFSGSIHKIELLNESGKTEMINYMNIILTLYYKDISKEKFMTTVGISK
jgi:hypothetical protein